MLTAPRHLSTAELERGLPEVLASPPDNGRLVSIVVRPAVKPAPSAHFRAAHARRRHRRRPLGRRIIAAIPPAKFHS